MKRCAFLTLGETSGLVRDDELACEPLRALGWSVEAVPWRRHGVPWAGFDAVVLRSTWDYPDDLDAFIAVLHQIGRSETLLFNDLDLVLWNLHKTYLRDLAGRGVPIVPTVWRDRLDPESLPGLFEEVGAEEIVVKPVVGANANGAFRLDLDAIHERAGALELYYSSRALIAQPLVAAVLEEGEYSLFFFDGRFSHSVLKTPKAEDFRVQEELGGMIRRVEAGGELLAAGESVLEALGEPPLYARVDLVRSNDGLGFWLMELELVEPSLYLRMDREAPNRFATALHLRATASRGGRSRSTPTREPAR